MSQLSAFKPSNKRYYQVTDFTVKEEEKEITPQIISTTPVMRLKITQSPTPRSVSCTPDTGPRSKKKWNEQLKKIAVAKAKEIGLTKATRFLQIHFPNEYSDLAPSTLQYWIQKAEVA